MRLYAYSHYFFKHLNFSIHDDQYGRDRMAHLSNLIYVLTIAVGLFYRVCSDDSVLDAANLTYQITSMVDEELAACNQTSGGFGVAVIAKNRVGSSRLTRNLIYAKGFNYKDLENNIRADENTLFCIGSVTKHVTATLLVHVLDLLKEKGYRYSLQTLVTDLDPSLNFTGSQLMGITVEDILSHRTGLPEVFGQFSVGYPKNTTRKHLAWVAANLPRSAANRQKWQYNNHVYASAGYFTEILAEKLLKRFVSWENLTRLYLLDPLEINDDVDFSGYHSKFVSRTSKPYHFTTDGQYKELDPETFTLIEPGGPAGSICLTPKAMIVWMQFLLDRGRYKSKQIVSRASIENTWKTRIPLFDKRADATEPRVQNLGNKTFTLLDYSQEIMYNPGYALGWMETRHRGYRHMEHSGAVTSYSTLLTMYPDANVSIITVFAAMTPSSETIMRLLHFKIFDLVMELAPVDASNATCGNAPSTSGRDDATDTSEGQKTSIDPKYYVGTFRNPVHGSLTISRNGASGLFMLMGRYGNATIVCLKSGAECELHMNGILWYVYDSGPDETENTGSPSSIPVSFNFTRTGYVSHVTMPMYSMNFPPVFTKA
ncbi:uncharacterized protein LOC129585296 isoform X2 [Paramacrobiotus metropolitanus]|uniref:uncharacterized protein LOC129585296 isoform X2 n=1 Tax=Paramacrobiotus metropolitanus TaxID=2943436 RepID=UPI002445A225|nr:uncharacterized protein LOC129585296 isoform X2 [Paramacrobiotus metropolitanus]